MTETARLATGAENRNWLARQSLIRKIREHHPVTPCLPGPDGIEEPRDYHWKSVLAPMSEAEPFVHCLRAGVRPARVCRWTESQIVVFAKRRAVAFTVDLRRGGKQHDYATACALYLRRGVQNNRCSEQVVLDSSHRTFKNETDTHC